MCTTELYQLVHDLAAFIVPQEYGITKEEKARIGRKIAGNLIKKVGVGGGGVALGGVLGGITLFQQGKGEDEISYIVVLAIINLPDEKGVIGGRVVAVS